MKVYRFIIEEVHIGKYCPIPDNVNLDEYGGNYHQWMDELFDTSHPKYAGEFLARSFYRSYKSVEDMLDKINEKKIEWSTTVDSTQVSLKLIDSDIRSRMLQIGDVKKLVPDELKINLSPWGSITITYKGTAHMPATAHKLMEAYDKTIHRMFMADELTWMGEGRNARDFYEYNIA